MKDIPPISSAHWYLQTNDPSPKFRRSVNEKQMDVMIKLCTIGLNMKSDGIRETYFFLLN